MTRNTLRFFEIQCTSARFSQLNVLECVQLGADYPGFFLCYGTWFYSLDIFGSVAPTVYDIKITVKTHTGLFARSK